MVVCSGQRRFVVVLLIVVVRSFAVVTGAVVVG